ncbi:MAG: type I DNA topoisomerase [Deltaproteobacteria bacterium]|nr:type I DNA topoisomerase [Deltaproteobacteria bacterium]
MSKLLVVESPAKARTIKKYLGKDFVVMASVGHVKDLPVERMGVDVEHDFRPEYIVVKGKTKVLKDIKAAAKKAEAVFLGPDPDREGEAIAWHIREEIKKDNPHVFRVMFHEITKRAVSDALGRPGDLDMDKVESQQTRRILDRLVGYELSPLLWKKVMRGLSAGRVQSVAVRLVVEREREIQAFVAREYWTIDVDLDGGVSPRFLARLTHIDGKKAEVGAAAEANALVERLRSISPYVLKAVEKKERKKNPPPPFITSKLQQVAFNRLGFSAKRTMAVAQGLYEGVELGEEGAQGLITYMRTDSTRVAADAIEKVRGHIASAFGQDFLPEKPNFFASRKGAQEAHEAIRPTNVDLTPQKVRQHLDRDQSLLYEMIWQRFVASQMRPAVYDQTAFVIECGAYTFRATGSNLRFPGYLSVYGVEEKDEAAGGVDGKNGNGEAGEIVEELPDLHEGARLKLMDVKPEQHFTQPPPRFTEGSLVKELEEKGIGRPSTYATILSTIVDKKYVEKKENRISPTELGFVVTDLLVKSFPKIMDVAFTAGMEERLDEIEEGKTPWLCVMRGFYGDFAKWLKTAQAEMKDLKKEEKPTDIKCERCGGAMVIKWGRNGSFLACSKYPECKNTMEYKTGPDGKVAPVPKEFVDRKCSECGAQMVKRRGRYGEFLSCSRYPDCKHVEPVTTGMACPEGCGGSVVRLRGRGGRSFFGCTSYPKCKFISWYPPIAEKCPDCGSSFLVEKTTKRDGSVVACPKKECGYKRPKPEAAPA